MKGWQGGRIGVEVRFLSLACYHDSVVATSNSARRKAKELKRVGEIIDRLEDEYGGATCALNHDNPFHLLVAAILSAQCTDVRVNQVTPKLFAAYPTAESLAGADLEHVQKLVRSTGFFRNKSRNLKAAATMLATEYGGELPRTMKEMLALPGVARKTANVVLGTGYGIASGVVVDTHVGRISQRLALTSAKNPVMIEKDLMAQVSPEKWIDFSHWVIHHGRQVCQARKPRCRHCLLADLCPYYQDQANT